MSIPPIFSRAPNLLQSQFAISTLNRTQLSLFQVQQELSTGKAITRYSDDPVKASVISMLNDRLGLSAQHAGSLDQADSSLSTLDQALSDASDLVNQAKSIASSEVGLGATAAERLSQSHVVDSMIQSLYSIANRQGVAGHIFSGSTPSSPAVGAFADGYRYLGQGSGLVTDMGLGGDIPMTLGGDTPIGSMSSRVQGDVDLRPALTSSTRIADLSGARGTGVALGPVQFSFNGGARVQIDLSGADTVGDLTTRITNALHDYEQANHVTVLGPGGVSINGGSLSIDLAPPQPPATSSLQFFDLGNATTAQDLGLTATPATSFTSTAQTGLELGAKLTWGAPISSLRGITTPPALGSLKINNLGQSRTIDLSGAQTLEDVKNAIEGSGLGVHVEINADRTGINVVNDVASGRNSAMSIEEVAGGNQTATRLGIRTLSASTRISDFNFGKGVQIADGNTDAARNTDFTITLGDSAQTHFTVDLRPQDMSTVQSVIDRINAAAQAAGVNVPADFQAGLSDTSNGLVLKQNTAFPTAIKIEAENNSPAAQQLGLSDGSFDASTGTFRATDHATVRADNLFTTLIDLRDALKNNDTSGITVAGEEIETSVDRLAQTRAIVGAYAQRVQDGKKQQQDQTVLDEQTRSTLQDTDYTQAAVQLNLLQTQLQAGLTTTAQQFSRSLLDYLG